MKDISDKEIFESIDLKKSNFSLGFQKYVYIAVLQTPMFPPKKQKRYTFF